PLCPAPELPLQAAKAAIPVWDRIDNRYSATWPSLKTHSKRLLRHGSLINSHPGRGVRQCTKLRRELMNCLSGEDIVKSLPASRMGD
ncbi:MAG: hypothetical protein E6699_25355, partial [Bradyrhizobium sp.]|uniref:hypothetical protein n=1 Tax=Bradyrhizobium sp. TaxID=376 RepID=UPI00290487E1